MDRGRGRDPSPLRSGIMHAGLSAAVFTGIAAVIGAGVHFTGDANASGPRHVIALFDVSQPDAPSLSGRFPDKVVTYETEPLVDLSLIHI